MNSSELDRQFMAKLRAKGLTDKMIENLILAKPELNIFTMLARDMKVFSDSLEERGKE